MRIELYLIPGRAKERRFENRAVVNIDILRASTTICKALKEGARAIIPVEEPHEAAEMRSNIGSDTTLLAGERGGLKIDNFDLGNSPMEFVEKGVKGKTIIMTTTNGTRSYRASISSSFSLTGAFVNISMVTDFISRAGLDVAILCAGNDGDFSLEDTLCGGMLIHKLIHEKKMKVELNDAASLALILFENSRADLARVIAGGEHGRLLAELGFVDDVRLSSQPDSLPILPFYKNNLIVAGGD
jgi:2-phosphosulfolactate phosphatase